MAPLSDPAVQNPESFRMLIQKSAGKTFWVGITFDMVVFFLLIRQETGPSRHNSSVSWLLPRYLSPLRRSRTMRRWHPAVVPFVGAVDCAGHSFSSQRTHGLLGTAIVLFLSGRLFYRCTRVMSGVFGRHGPLRIPSCNP